MQPVNAPKLFDAYDFQMMQAQIAALEQAVNELRAVAGKPAVRMPRPEVRRRA